MRKYLLAIAMMLFNLSVNADKLKVPTGKDNPGSNPCHPIMRAPTQSIVEVWYDDDLALFDIQSSADEAAQVFIYDEQGCILNSSETANVTLAIPQDYHGLVVIVIQGDGWREIGQIEI